MSQSREYDAPAPYDFEYSDAKRSKRLVAKADDPLTEISLFDWNLQPVRGVHKSLGTLEENVSPGLYKVRFSTAATVHDELVEVPADAKKPVLVEAPMLQFPSPVPLYAKAEGSDSGVGSPLLHARADLAERAGQKVEKSEGAGAQVFLYVQAWAPPTLPEASEVGEGAIRIVRCHPSASRARPGRGVILYNPMTGKPVVDLGDKRFHHTDERVSCVAVEVPPGSYLLRSRTPGIGTYEIPIHASRGWQTAVFVQSRPLPLGEKSALFADIPQASIFLFREGEHWKLNDISVRLTEQAKWLIRRPRPAVEENRIQKMLKEKQFNPMLGIFAAHFLQKQAAAEELRQGAKASGTERVTLGIVLRHLKELLEDHPDLVALDAEMPDGKRMFSAHEFAFPPMLRAGWDLALKTIDQGRVHIPEGSFADSIIEELPRGNLWLCWKRMRTSMSLQRATASFRAPQASRRSKSLSSSSSSRPPTTSSRPKTSDRSATPRPPMASPEAGDDLGRVLLSDDLLSSEQTLIHGRVLEEDATEGVRVGNSSDLQQQYLAALKEAQDAGVDVPEYLQSFSVGSQAESTASTSDSETLRAKAKTPLERLVVSWKQSAPATEESLQDLSESSGLPRSIIDRTLGRLEE